MPDIIRHHAGRIPMLGVCLGHQALAEYLGGRLVNMPVVFHGIQSILRQTKRKSILFKDIPDTFQAGRYHSWEVVWDTPQNGVEIIAEDEDSRIMAFQETSKNLFGVQFHPESIMTPEGPRMLENFINLCKQQHV
jgi:anthranilate synthase component 2